MHTSSSGSDDRSSFQSPKNIFAGQTASGETSAPPGMRTSKKFSRSTDVQSSSRTASPASSASEAPIPLLSADTMEQGNDSGTEEREEPFPARAETVREDDDENGVSDQDISGCLSAMRLWLKVKGEALGAPDGPSAEDAAAKANMPPVWCIPDLVQDKVKRPAKTARAGYGPTQTKAASANKRQQGKQDSKKNTQNAKKVYKDMDAENLSSGSGDTNEPEENSTTIEASPFKKSSPFPFPEGTPQYLLSYPIEFPEVRARAARMKVMKLADGARQVVKTPCPGFPLERVRNTVMFEFMSLALAPAVLRSLHWSTSFLVTAVGFSKLDNTAMLNSMARFWGLSVPLAEKVYNSTRIPTAFSGHPFILPKGSEDDQKKKTELIRRSLNVPGTVVVTTSEHPLLIDCLEYTEICPVSFEFWQAPFSTSRTRTEYMKKEMAIPAGAAGSYVDKCIDHAKLGIYETADWMKAEVRQACPGAVNGLAEGAALRKLCEYLLELLFVRPMANGECEESPE